MRIKHIHRAPICGFTLLEAMLAFAVLGMVLATTYTISVRSIRQQMEARQDYDLTIMARAILDEYVQTYPQMQKSGTYKNTWDWQISEEPQEVLVRTDYDYYYRFIRITVRVEKKETGGKAYSLFTVIARRAPGI